MEHSECEKQEVTQTSVKRLDEYRQDVQKEMRGMPNEDRLWHLKHQDELVAQNLFFEKQVMEGLAQIKESVDKRPTYGYRLRNVDDNIGYMNDKLQRIEKSAGSIELVYLQNKNLILLLSKVRVSLVLTNLLLVLVGLVIFFKL